MSPEQELALQSLLDKMEKWVVQQPEWTRLMGNPDRATRKRVAQMLAKELLLIPSGLPTGQPGRQLRRQMIRALEKDGF